MEKGMSGKMGSKREEWKRDGLTRGREGRKVRQKMKRREERRREEGREKREEDKREGRGRKGTGMTQKKEKEKDEEEGRGEVYSERYTVYHIRAMTSQD